MKTFKVNEFRIKANELLKSDISQDEKQVLCSVLEYLLMATNNYHGFEYNYWMSGGHLAWVAAGMPGFPEKELYMTDDKKYEYCRYYY